MTAFSPGSELVELVCSRLRDELDNRGRVSDDEKRALAREVIRRQAPLLGGRAVERTVREVTARLGGLGPIEQLLDDPDVTDVLVNGAGPVWVERNGELLRTDIHLEGPAVRMLVERLVAAAGRRVDRSSPVADVLLADGSRANIVVDPVAVDGPYISIRRFSVRPVPVEVFAHPEVADLLREAVRRRANVVISGATGAGKTTLLNALAACFDPSERVVTIEDVAELRLQHAHVVRLEARPANVDGAGEVTVGQLFKNALRMRPDRIVVGEVRGAEVLQMLHAMNTGHEGSLTTCHANGPEDALRRLELLALSAGDPLPPATVRSLLATCIDLMVHVRKTERGERRVSSVCLVEASRGSRPRLLPLFGERGRHRRVSPLAGRSGVRSERRSGKEEANRGEPC
ncbi:MAG: hypothetical protein KatS3mg008_1530 [Acidimicrobiales bacterium]|nr:MAG: hypothetical protein KatS3mg008_1530 [Acidimicrobiales bacterium]